MANDGTGNYSTFEAEADNQHHGENHHVLPPNESNPHEHTIYWKLFRQNQLAVYTVCYCYAAFGMSIAILGPVLLDLSCLTASSLSAISWLFFFQTFLFSAGSILAGYLVTRKTFQDETILLVCMILLPLTVFLVPFWQEISILAIDLLIMGLILGCLENMCNIKMIQLFKDKVAPFLQALYFCYGFGAFLTPFIAKPFLSNQDCTILLHINDTDNTVYKETHSVNATVSFDSITEARGTIKIHYAFAIVAALQLPAIALVFYYGVKNGTWSGKAENLIPKSLQKAPDNPGSFELDYTEGDGKGGAISANNNFDHSSFFNSNRIKDNKQIVIIIILAGSVNAIFDGLQAVFSDFGYTYAVDTVAHIENRRSEAAYTESVFWGSFALGRLTSIFIAAYFFPIAMIMTQMVTRISIFRGFTRLLHCRFRVVYF